MAGTAANHADKTAMPWPRRAPRRFHERKILRAEKNGRGSHAVSSDFRAVFIPLLRGGHFCAFAASCRLLL